MTERLESNYNCANASEDLHELQLLLNQLPAGGKLTPEQQEEANRLHNLIHFIKNKCDIPNG
ncbi:DUF2524 domain-containing protein [Paenibacillus sp. GCM10012307]|uniref:DUF2524 domain-containing protein n=1 Tax=Paenibacillus roseus TaxID=2798579 RepID=A0A934JAG4_9BACL|nr:DUF2524 domain-containing protein [Paenibacillus roseus]MBJ6363238.1 DUF2524 domain-containing protein [Paenibacillus roseus]